MEKKALKLENAQFVLINHPRNLTLVGFSDDSQFQAKFTTRRDEPQCRGTICNAFEVRTKGFSKSTSRKSVFAWKSGKTVGKMAVVKSGGLHCVYRLKDKRIQTVRL